jgi:Transposase
MARRAPVKARPAGQPLPVAPERPASVAAGRSGRATLDHGLSNGLIESVNTKVRVITRMAFGFHNPVALIGLAVLVLGGRRPTLPGR